MPTLSLYARTDGLLEAGDDETQIFISAASVTKEIIAKVADQNTGTVPMLRTWRMWMRQTADWMAWQGAKMPLCYDKQGNPWGERAFNENDAHELFTHKWLGSDENGIRYSWRMRGEDAAGSTPAPKSKRLWAMECHEAWATDRGIKLTIPDDSEYRNLQRAQVA